jgi:serine/threonine-protein kinase
LFDRLQRGRIPLPEALRILDQIARGLEAAHAQGVTHRDLKPENVFLVHLPGEAPIVKLVDFGLSKLAADADRRAERTQSGVAIGTPMYMSPEQMRGPDVDHRTDIYALGCVAYELLLGSSPFLNARSAPELYAAHLHASPPLPRSIWPEIPPQLDLVLFAMLAKDPAHRPTLAQVRSVIADVRFTPSQRAATERVAPRLPKTTTRAGTVAVAAITLIGGIVIGAVLTSRLRGEASRETPVTAPVAPVEAPAALTVPDAAPSAPIPRPRDAGSSRVTDAVPSHRTHSSVSRPPPPKVSATITAPAPVSLDGGVAAATATVVDAPPPAPAVPEKTMPRPNKPMDKNQTVNPFPTKRAKVNP